MKCKLDGCDVEVEGKRRYYCSDKHVSIAGQRRYHAKHPDKRKEFMRQYDANRGKYSSPSAFLKNAWTKAIGRCKQYNESLDAFAMKLFTDNPPSECACCGATLDYGYNPTGRSGRAPSIDRVDNTKGYVFGNIGIICDRCNIRKRDSSIRQLEQIITYMRDRDVS